MPNAADVEVKLLLGYPDERVFFGIHLKNQHVTDQIIVYPLVIADVKPIISGLLDLQCSTVLVQDINCSIIALSILYL